MYEASNLVVGASLLAARLVADGHCNVSFNISGGLHHANPGLASGFCIDDDTYLWAFRKVVPPLVKSFKPDILVT